MEALYELLRALDGPVIAVLSPASQVSETRVISSVGSAAADLVAEPEKPVVLYAWTIR
jgi:hypothetical protein